MQHSQGVGESASGLYQAIAGPSTSSGAARQVPSDHLHSSASSPGPSSIDIPVKLAPVQSPNTRIQVQTVLDEGWERFARTVGDELPDLPDYEDVEPAPPTAPTAHKKTPREVAREEAKSRFYMISRLPEPSTFPLPSRRQLPTPPSGTRDFVRGPTAKKSRTVDGQVTTALVLSDSDSNSPPRATSSKVHSHSKSSSPIQPSASSSSSKPTQPTEKLVKKERKRRKASSSSDDAVTTYLPVFKKSVATNVAKADRDRGEEKGKRREGHTNKILGAEKSEFEAKTSDVRPVAKVDLPSGSPLAKAKEKRLERPSDRDPSLEGAEPREKDLEKMIEGVEMMVEGSRQSQRLQERKRITKKQKGDKLAERDQRRTEKKVEKEKRREGKIRELDKYEDLWERPMVPKRSFSTSRPTQDFIIDLQLLRLSSADCDPQKRMTEQLSISASLILEDHSSSKVSTLVKSSSFPTKFNCTYDNSRDPERRVANSFGFVPRHPVYLRMLLDLKALPAHNFDLVLLVIGQQGESTFLEAKTVLVKNGSFVPVLAETTHTTLELSVHDPDSTNRCELLLRTHECDHITSELEKVQTGLERIALRVRGNDRLPVGMSKRELREVVTPKYATPTLKSGRRAVDFEHYQVLGPGTLTASEARPTPHGVRPLLQEAYQLIDAKVGLSPSQQDLLKMQRSYSQLHPLSPSSKNRELACWQLRARQGVFRDADMEEALVQHLLVLQKVKLLDEDGIHEILQSVREETKLVLAREKEG